MFYRNFFGPGYTIFDVLVKAATNGDSEDSYAVAVGRRTKHLEKLIDRTNTWSPPERHSFAQKLLETRVIDPATYVQILAKDSFEPLKWKLNELTPDQATDLASITRATLNQDLTQRSRREQSWYGRIDPVNADILIANRVINVEKTWNAGQKAALISKMLKDGLIDEKTANEAFRRQSIMPIVNKLFLTDKEKLAELLSSSRALMDHHASQFFSSHPTPPPSTDVEPSGAVTQAIPLPQESSLAAPPGQETGLPLQPSPAPKRETREPATNKSPAQKQVQEPEKQTKQKKKVKVFKGYQYVGTAGPLSRIHARRLNTGRAVFGPGPFVQAIPIYEEVEVEE